MRSLYIVALLIFITDITSQAQSKHNFYLNEGELYDGPIYIHSKHMLISYSAQKIESSRVTIWDVKTSSVIKNIFIGNNTLSGFELSPTEKYIVFKYADSTKIFDLNTLEWAFAYSNSKFYDFNQSFSSPRFFKQDNIMLFYTNDSLHHVDTGNWSVIEYFDCDVKINLNEISLKLFFSSSAIGVFENNQLIVIDVPSGKTTRTYSFVKYLVNDYSGGQILAFDDFKKALILSSFKDLSKLALVDMVQESITKELYFDINLERLSDDAWLPSGNSFLLFGNRYFENSFKNGYKFYKINIHGDTFSAKEFHFDKVPHLRNYTYGNLMFNDHTAILIDADSKSLNTVSFRNGESYSFKTQQEVQHASLIDSNLVIFTTSADSIKTGPISQVINAVTGKSRGINPYPYMIRGITPTDPFNLICRNDSGNYSLTKIKEDFSINTFKELNTKFKKIGIYPINYYNDTLVFNLVDETYYDNFWKRHFIFSDSLQFPLTNALFVHLPTCSYKTCSVTENVLESFGGSDCYVTFKNDENSYFQIPIGAYIWDTRTSKLIGFLDLDSLSKLGKSVNFYNIKLKYNSSRDKLLFDGVDGFGLLDIRNSVIKKLFYVQTYDSKKVSFCNQDRNIFVQYLDKLCVYDASDGTLVFSQKKSESQYLHNSIPNEDNSRYLLEFSGFIELRDFIDKRYSRRIDKADKVWFANYLNVGMGKDLFYVYEATGDLTLRSVDNGNILYRKNIGKSINNFEAFILKDTAVLYFNQNGLPTIWNFTKNTINIFQSTGDIGPFLQFVLYPNKNLLITTSFNNVYFWDFKKGILVNRLIVADTSEYLFIDYNGYYMGDKAIFPKLRVNLNGRVFLPIQLDAIYNRPDKVLQFMGTAFGSTDTLLISGYHRAWQKRVKMLAIDTISAKNGFSLPESDFKNRFQIEYDQITDQLMVQLWFRDSTCLLDKYNIWVNGVPVFGHRGVTIRDQKTHEFNKSVTIKLSEGINKIETSVMNANQAESYRFPLYVRYSPIIPKTHKIYFVGIGVDRYLNPKNNLSFSVKDIRDLAHDFKEKYFGSISIDTFFNDRATCANIRSIKETLLNTDVNDKVIISYSGHGLLDDNFDYYLATNTIDFDNPAKDGLPFEDLEWLLDSIPARRKLLLVDACHSGEVDKQDLLAIKNDKPDGTKGLEMFYDYKPKIGMQNSFELMQDIFANLNMGTGATVLAAAGGTQFAFEKGDLKNGVFTYSILELMQKKDTITVSELKKCVGTRVVELTNGLQKPTSRSENIEFDWTFW